VLETGDRCGRLGVTPDMALHRAQARREFLVDSGRLILVTAGLAGGLGRVRIATAASQVSIGVTETPCVAPTYIAVSQGFFRDEGLDATVVDITTPSNLGRAIDGPAGLATARVDAVMSEVWSAAPPRMPTGLSLGDLVITTALQSAWLRRALVPLDSRI
jgi:hypothetical protein